MLTAVPAVAHGAARLRQAWGSLGRAVTETLAREQGRHALWLPVGLMLGVALWFQLPRDPPGWALALMALGGCGLAVALSTALKHRPGRGLTALAAAALSILAGLLLAAWETARTDTRVLAAPAEGTLVAIVLRVEPRLERHDPDGGPGDADPAPAWRLVLAPETLEAAPLEVSPIRLFHRDRWPPPVGARIAVAARLQPPGLPLAPGAFDPARWGWFAGLGGAGTTLGPVTVLAPPAPAAPVAALRARITAAITAALPPDQAALAVALLVGDRSLLSATQVDSLRDSGLAHLLSISGLHVGLVMGWVFLSIRLGLVLVPGLAVRIATRKLAAVAAALAALFYLVLSGAEVPSQRATVMGVVAMVAILVDRPPFTMRVLALALVGVVAVQPHTVIEPGFQMSFAATAVLVALVERPAGARPAAATARRRGRRPPAWRRLLVATALTSLVAGAATAPYGAWHFQRLQLLGLAANLIAVPITGLVVMPAGLLAVVLMPFGLEAPALTIMGSAIALVMVVSDALQASVGSGPVALAVPLLASLGLAWVTIWRQPWRWAGVVPLAVAFGLIALGRPAPVLLVADGGASWLARSADGTTRGGGRRFTLAQWQRHFDLPPPRPCEEAACVVRLADGRILARPRGAAALVEACARADIVLPPRPVRGCAADLTLAPDAITAAAALTLAAGDATPKAARSTAVCRAWSAPRPGCAP